MSELLPYMISVPRLFPGGDDARRYGTVEWMRAVFGSSEEQVRKQRLQAITHLSFQPGPGRTEKGEDGRYRPPAQKALTEEQADAARHREKDVMLAAMKRAREEPIL